MSERLTNQYLPESVAPPGETLAEIVADRGMTQAELAERMGRPKKTISEIVGGKAEITPETALQLERVLGVPASFWSNLERHYRDSLARASERRELLKHSDWPAKFPLRELTKFGWVRSAPDPVGQIRALLDFFSVSSVDQWQTRYREVAVAYRRPAKFEPDLYALTAWLRAGEREAQQVECAPFNLEAFRVALTEARSLTRIADPREFIPRLREIAARCGVVVAFIREVKGSRACGATRWLGPNRALIQLSLRYKSNDHLWFTFFHEAGHIVLHGKREVFVEFQNGSTGTELLEAEANAFAAEHLIPKKEFRGFMVRETFTEAAVRAFARECGIAPGIVVGRLQHERAIPFSHLNGLKIRYEWESPKD